MHKKSCALAAAIALHCLSVHHAQQKVSKHGILEAKSDSGFIAMVDKGGFAANRGLKVELLQIKAGETLMKALISGEIDSVDSGGRPRYGCQNCRLHMAGRAASRSRQGRDQDTCRSQGKNRCHFLARIAAGSPVPRHA